MTGSGSNRCLIMAESDENIELVGSAEQYEIVTSPSGIVAVRSMDDRKGWTDIETTAEDEDDMAREQPSREATPDEDVTKQTDSIGDWIAQTLSSTSTFSSMLEKTFGKKEQGQPAPRRKGRSSGGSWDIPLSEDALMTKSGRPVKFKTNNAGEIIFITEAASASTSGSVEPKKSKTSKKSSSEPSSKKKSTPVTPQDDLKKKNTDKEKASERLDITQTSFADVL